MVLDNCLKFLNYITCSAPNAAHYHYRSPIHLETRSRKTLAHKNIILWSIFLINATQLPIPLMIKFI